MAEGSPEAATSAAHVAPVAEVPGPAAATPKRKHTVPGSSGSPATAGPAAKRSKATPAAAAATPAAAVGDGNKIDVMFKQNERLQVGRGSCWG